MREQSAPVLQLRLLGYHRMVCSGSRHFPPIFFSMFSIDISLPMFDYHCIDPENAPLNQA